MSSVTVVQSGSGRTVYPGWAAPRPRNSMIEQSSTRPPPNGAGNESLASTASERNTPARWTRA